MSKHTTLAMTDPDDDPDEVGRERHTNPIPCAGIIKSLHFGILTFDIPFGGLPVRPREKFMVVYKQSYALLRFGNGDEIVCPRREAS